MQPKWEVADVLHKTDIATYSVHQQKTLRAIRDCRTAALGGHVDACDECGTVHISYNSCRDRHCPKCQGHKREQWIHKREEELLPCTYSTLYPNFIFLIHNKNPSSSFFRFLLHKWRKSINFIHIAQIVFDYLSTYTINGDVNTFNM